MENKIENVFHPSKPPTCRVFVQLLGSWFCRRLQSLRMFLSMEKIHRQIRKSSSCPDWGWDRRRSSKDKRIPEATRRTPFGSCISHVTLRCSSGQPGHSSAVSESQNHKRKEKPFGCTIPRKIEPRWYKILEAIASTFYPFFRRESLTKETWIFQLYMLHLQFPVL